MGSSVATQPEAGEGAHAGRRRRRPGGRPSARRAPPPAPLRRSPPSSSAWTRSFRPRVARGEQDAPALVHAEDALLAEDVGEHGEAALGDRRDHLLDQQARRSARGSRGARAAPRARPGRSAPRVTGWRRGREADRLEAADLGRRLEAVAALHLGGGGAAEQHLVEARGDERRPAPRRTPRASPRPSARCRRPRRRSPGSSRPARRRRISSSRSPGEGEVGVGVDEAGHDRGARGVERLAPGRRRDRRREVGRRARPRRCGPPATASAASRASAEVAQARRPCAGPGPRASRAGRCGGPRSRRRSCRRARSRRGGRVEPGDAPRACCGPCAPLSDRAPRDGATPSVLPRKRASASLAAPSTGGAREAHHERALALAAERVARGPRLHPHAQRHAVARVAQVAGPPAYCPDASSRRFRKRRLSSTSASSCRSSRCVRRVMRARMSVRSAVRWPRRSRMPALHVVGAGLGQLEQAVGLQLGLLDDRLRLLAGVLADVLGRPSAR